MIARTKARCLVRNFFGVLLVAGGIAIGACVAPQLSPQASNADTPAQPTKWEYLKVAVVPSYQNPKWFDELNSLGDQGWEIFLKDSDYWYLKKAKP